MEYIRFDKIGTAVKYISSSKRGTLLQAKECNQAAAFFTITKKRHPEWWGYLCRIDPSETCKAYKYYIDEYISTWKEIREMYNYLKRRRLSTIFATFLSFFETEQWRNEKVFIVLVNRVQKSKLPKKLNFFQFFKWKEILYIFSLFRLTIEREIKKYPDTKSLTTSFMLILDPNITKRSRLQTQSSCNDSLFFIKLEKDIKRISRIDYEKNRL